MGGTGVQMGMVIRCLNAGMSEAQERNRECVLTWYVRPNEASQELLTICIKWAMGPILFTKYTKYGCEHSQISETYLLFFFPSWWSISKIYMHVRCTHKQSLSKHSLPSFIFHHREDRMWTQRHAHLQSRRPRRWFDVLRARHYVHSFIWTHSWGWIMMRRCERSVCSALLARREPVKVVSIYLVTGQHHPALNTNGHRHLFTSVYMGGPFLTTFTP